ncbi:hypothetical protein FGO68_gene8194 [Halteria grandinella]|uniref:Uncharacterized protein n=1 Tax=Halteria grandinella TaxID=5974 RepID=A0A8J8T4T8_HALGN|nr:hypothetical protein FGO68_gene8194 [Halteria grandinella]
MNASNSTAPQFFQQGLPIALKQRLNMRNELRKLATVNAAMSKERNPSVEQAQQIAINQRSFRTINEKHHVFTLKFDKQQSQEQHPQEAIREQHDESAIKIFSARNKPHRRSIEIHGMSYFPDQQSHPVSPQAVPKNAKQILIELMKRQQETKQQVMGINKSGESLKDHQQFLRIYGTKKQSGTTNLSVGSGGRKRKLLIAMRDKAEEMQHQQLIKLYKESLQAPVQAPVVDQPRRVFEEFKEMVQRNSQLSSAKTRTSAFQGENVNSPNQKMGVESATFEKENLQLNQQLMLTLSRPTTNHFNTRMKDHYWQSLPQQDEVERRSKMEEPLLYQPQPKEFGTSFYQQQQDVQPPAVNQQSLASISSPFKLKYKMKIQDFSEEKPPLKTEFTFRRFLPQFHEVQISSKAGNVKRVEAVAPAQKDDNTSLKSPLSSKHLLQRKSMSRPANSFRTQTAVQQQRGLMHASMMQTDKIRSPLFSGNRKIRLYNNNDDLMLDEQPVKERARQTLIDI